MSLELESLRVLCRNVVDYAGTFRPAALDLDGAVKRYEGYRVSGDSWMLHRFVAAARDLDRLAEIAPANAGWELSVVCRDAEDLDHARAWQSDVASIVSLETSRAAEAADSDCDVYVERSLPVSRDELAELKKHDAMLKIRLGGATTPSTSAVAQVLLACAETGLSLKATAGLHRAIRSADHGFVNLILAATLAHFGGDGEEIEALLDERDAALFAFESDAVSWRAHRFDISALASGRRLFHSFGSCSFEEPLESLGFLTP